MPFRAECFIHSCLKDRAPQTAEAKWCSKPGNLCIVKCGFDCKKKKKRENHTIMSTVSLRLSINTLPTRFLNENWHLLITVLNNSIPVSRWMGSIIYTSLGFIQICKDFFKHFKALLKTQASPNLLKQKTDKHTETERSIYFGFA